MEWICMQINRDQRQLEQCVYGKSSWRTVCTEQDSDLLYQLYEENEPKRVILLLIVMYS